MHKGPVIMNALYLFSEPTWKFVTWTGLLLRLVIVSSGRGCSRNSYLKTPKICANILDGNVDEPLKSVYRNSRALYGTALKKYKLVWKKKNGFASGESPSRENNDFELGKTRLIFAAVVINNLLSVISVAQSRSEWFFYIISFGLSIHP